MPSATELTPSATVGASYETRGDPFEMEGLGAAMVGLPSATVGASCGTQGDPFEMEGMSAGMEVDPSEMEGMSAEMEVDPSEMEGMSDEMEVDPSEMEGMSDETDLDPSGTEGMSDEMEVDPSETQGVGDGMELDSCAMEGVSDAMEVAPSGMERLGDDMRVDPSRIEAPSDAVTALPCVTMRASFGAGVASPEMVSLRSCSRCAPVRIELHIPAAVAALPNAAASVAAACEAAGAGDSVVDAVHGRTDAGHAGRVDERVAVVVAVRGALQGKGGALERTSPSPEVMQLEKAIALRDQSKAARIIELTQEELGDDRIALGTITCMADEKMTPAEQAQLLECDVEEVYLARVRRVRAVTRALARYEQESKPEDEEAS